MRTIHQKDMASSWLVPHYPNRLQGAVCYHIQNDLPSHAFLHAGMRAWAHLSTAQHRAQCVGFHNADEVLDVVLRKGNIAGHGRMPGDTLTGLAADV